MQFKLYHDQFLVGIIRQFPDDITNLCGSIELSKNADWNTTIGKKISGLISYGIGLDPLLEKDVLIMTHYILREEPKHAEIIQSNKWNITDEFGVKHKIIVPCFHIDNQISWTWSNKVNAGNPAAN